MVYYVRVKILMLLWKWLIFNIIGLNFENKYIGKIMIFLLSVF